MSVGLLVLTAIAPAAPAFAVDGDHEVIGTADPATAISAPGGGLDAGPADEAGEDLPVDASAPAEPNIEEPAEDGAGDDGDVGAPVADTVDGVEAPRSAAPAPSEAQMQPSDTGSASPMASPPPDGPGVVAPTALATAPGAVGQQRGRLATKARVRASADAWAALAHSRSGAVVSRKAAKPAAPVRRSASSVPAAVTSAPTYVVRRVVARPVVATPAGGRAARGDRVHVVAAGESLWSIANDVLGGRATVAQVAREVNRLWELNGARIGTGNRDLLPVGARLELK